MDVAVPVDDDVQKTLARGSWEAREKARKLWPDPSAGIGAPVSE